MQVTSTFWAAIHSLPRAELAIIPTMKEEIQGYHMNPNYKKLVHPVQRNLRCHVVATVFLADGAPGNNLIKTERDYYCVWANSTKS